jgi:hypothetical protein
MDAACYNDTYSTKTNHHSSKANYHCSKTNNNYNDYKASCFDLWHSHSNWYFPLVGSRFIR